MSDKEKCLEAIDKMIDGLPKIKEKIINNIQLKNEDWLEVAMPLNNVINLLLNHKYIDYNEK